MIYAALKAIVAQRVAPSLEGKSRAPIHKIRQMSTLSREDLDAAIQAGNIGAVCIDTNIFESQQFAFHKGVLGELRNIATAGIEIVLPDVVEREITGHLKTTIAEFLPSLRKSLRTATSLGIAPDKLEGEVPVEVDSDKLAKERVATFKTHVSAKAFRVGDWADVSSVFDRYFNETPPFEAKKKSEFPDAFTLQALESWAATEGIGVFVVSDDKGWKDFARDSEYLHAGPSLSDLLVSVQRTDPVLVRNALSFISGSASDEIQARLSERLQVLETYVELSSAHYAEAETVDSSVLSVDVPRPEDLELVRKDENEIVLRWYVRAEAEFEVSVELSAFDSIDREYISLNTQTVMHQQELELETLITFTYEAGARGTELIFEDIEIVDRRIEIDLGEVEVDYSDDE